MLMMSHERLRMFQWLLLSVLAYFAATHLAGMQGDTDAGLWPRAQTVLWKIGHLNLAAYLGYWIDRHAFRDRISNDSPIMMHIRRSIIMGCSMIAFVLAL